MPRDLRLLYERIVFNIPTDLIQDAITFFEIFQSVDNSTNSKRALTLEELSIGVSAEAMSPTTEFQSEEEELVWLTDICDTTKARLRSSCRGLIYVAPPTNLKRSIFKSLPPRPVRWMHLTVKSFATDYKDKFYARAAEMGTERGRLIPVTDLHKFSMALSTKLLKMAAARWYGYGNPPRKCRTFNTKTVLPQEHVEGCACLVEFAEVPLPWDDRKKNAAKLASRIFQNVTQPYFDEVKRTCTMICPSLLDYHWDYQLNIENKHRKGGYAEGTFPKIPNGSVKRPKKPARKINHTIPDEEIDKADDDDDDGDDDDLSGDD
ncbi:uncharacterized protein LY89DRAFT_731955 [Mollisia scopiformis]|uniref:Uncharacterized protein n=1 Tax=Mollisia scopiformis TaxID=149040 RepID=A0A194XHF4_MOLSC|nr:uncharacterized protein LY89DRAFT_731955 [Mollisia scopiformis]KUJ19559.1 hypothetical protein LY89DRAFT_731955 [Mollisia scopiformis]